MGIYKTYREAVIANGSTKGIHTSMSGAFITQDVLTGRLLSGVNEGWNPCTPSDYLESLESFLATGKRLVSGDLITYLNGAVKSIENPKIMNTVADSQNQRYVLQVADDQVETAEEKEAFDAIDTTPQQVESLSGSEKPNISEWNGEGLPPVGAEFDFSYNGVSWERRVMLFNDGITCLMAHSEYTKNRWHYKCDDPNIMFRKPETPAEREQRERLEAAYDLYCDFTNSNVVDATCMCSYDFERSIFLPKWLTVVDKTGYRKKKDK